MILQKILTKQNQKIGGGGGGDTYHVETFDLLNNSTKTMWTRFISHFIFSRLSLKMKCK